MTRKNRFLLKLALIFTVPLASSIGLVLVLTDRLEEILDMEGSGAELFPEICAIVSLLIFILLAGVSIVAKLTDNLKADAFAFKNMEYERDTTHYTLYIAIAGIFVLLSILYSQCADPYMLGESRVSVVMMTFIPICIECAVITVTSIAFNRMEARS